MCLIDSCDSARVRRSSYGVCGLCVKSLLHNSPVSLHYSAFYQALRSPKKQLQLEPVFRAINLHQLFEQPSIRKSSDT